MTSKVVATLVAIIIAAFTAASQTAGNALVAVSTACVRSAPSHSAELITQQLMGMPLAIQPSGNGWSKVTTIDGYQGYIIDNSLIRITDAEYDSWLYSPRSVYTALTTGRVDAIDRPEPVSDIVPGAIVENIDTRGDSTIVRLPDGRIGLLPTAHLTKITIWANQPFNPQLILDYARQNLGTPYLWGGNSTKGMDCSGLTWTAYWLNGRLLQRDASRQAIMTTPSPSESALLDTHEAKELDSRRMNATDSGRMNEEGINSGRINDLSVTEPADLVFFVNSKGRINHVALIEEAGKTILHCSGMVKRNSLNPSSTDYHRLRVAYALRLSNIPPISQTPAASRILP